MNEPFDVEISRALKEDAVKSLQGWEFTPAMRAKVMERIRAEELTAEPPASPRHRRVAEWARPLTMVAAAAAAVVLAVNVNWSEFRMGSASKQEAASFAAPETQMAAASQPGTDQTGPENIARKSDTSAVQNAANANGEPGGTGSGSNAALQATVTSAPPAHAKRVAFALPEPEPMLGALSDSAPTLAAPPEEVKMAMVPGGEPKDSDVGMAFTAAVQNVSGAVADEGSVFTLTPFGLNFTSADMATVRDLALEDLTGASDVALAADGTVAVANGGDQLYLVSAEGSLQRTIRSAAPLRELCWSPDGRLAAAEGERVVVYAAATGEALFAEEAGTVHALAFMPDGTLAIYAEPPSGGRQLLLMGAKGEKLARVELAEAGGGLAIAGGGTVVVAGDRAFDRVGNLLWVLPMPATGAAALGADRVVAWNDHQVVNVSAADGMVLWEAEWSGTGRITRVVSAPDGALMAILAETDHGPVLWVVEAGGKVRLTERLEQMPVEIGIAADQVVMILPTAVQYRTIPE